MTKAVDLSKFNNAWYKPGNSYKIILWYFVNIFIIKNRYNPSSGLKILFLKLFGAIIGKGNVIKPGVSVKYPWKLTIGDFNWIGEDVWIDNLDAVVIENNVCISQGAMLLCGNHNYKKSTFDLVIGSIKLQEGSWVGAKSVVCPGVTLETHSILAVNSVATKDLQAYGIYQGNPAVKVRNRIID